MKNCRTVVNEDSKYFFYYDEKYECVYEKKTSILMMITNKINEVYCGKFTDDDKKYFVSSADAMYKLQKKVRVVSIIFF